MSQLSSLQVKVALYFPALGPENATYLMFLMQLINKYR